ncbi:copper-binding protein [Phycisphaera mikurensis]|uniref:Uncharacterized protein n=1 Tax=Phycisphaera mikurensis (strain NBRC 102666 / KCTC 22515 / FYK2301M01) TaxID=1142394 RepID=I0IHI8_PHYMF|nr:copper-binding protein [Phycisphaera mikurensis]MBB6440970.1 hypothetical protein [Phycisphaera mikurensis]BAM04726.1 hypothetical protein PSMK_25670 [Phycisphaera mikurensis NBRC 102666]
MTGLLRCAPAPLALVCLLCGFLPAAAGCGDADRNAATDGGVEAPVGHRYAMAGEVLSVAEEPIGGLPRLTIHHDPVPEFRDLETGEVVGMPAMSMPFPLAAGLNAPAVGERVSFTLLVDGGDHGGLPYVIVELAPEPKGSPAS